MASFRRPLPVLLVLLAILFATLFAAPWVGPAIADLVPAAFARDRAAEHERALAGRGRGELLPLSQILAQVERVLPGRMIETELDDDDGRRVVELDWLLPDGRRLELKVDARTGEWLKLEGLRLETAFRRPASAAGGRP